MRREAEHAGLHLSVRELLATLAGIEETVLLYHDGGKGRPRGGDEPSGPWPHAYRVARLAVIISRTSGGTATWRRLGLRRGPLAFLGISG